MAILRAQDMEGLSEADIHEVVGGWHAAIGKAILESWGLPETLQNAIQHQDELDTQLEGPVTLTNILIAAKLLAGGHQDLDQYPAIRRVGVAARDKALGVMEEFAEELQSVRSSLSD